MPCRDGGPMDEDDDDRPLRARQAKIDELTRLLCMAADYMYERDALNHSKFAELRAWYKNHSTHDIDRLEAEKAELEEELTARLAHDSLTPKQRAAMESIGLLRRKMNENSDEDCDDEEEVALRQTSELRKFIRAIDAQLAKLRSRKKSKTHEDVSLSSAPEIRHRRKLHLPDNTTTKDKKGRPRKRK